MKNFLFVLVIFSSLATNAQTSEDIQIDFLKYLKTNTIILKEDGLIKEESKINDFVSSFKETNYTKTFSIEVNPTLEYEIGELKADSDLYTVMFVKSVETNNEKTIEFLNIFKKTNSGFSSSEIDKSRQKWMMLCNTHLVDKLVKQLYMADANYYNRGRLIQGTKALTTEYSYMNSPSYSLKLSPKYVVSVNPEIVYEIGQCIGSYPLPYMLVWQKQADNSWKILLDSNY